MTDNNRSVDVRYIADLARINLSADEIDLLTKDMAAILDYVALLAEVDVDGVEPTAHATRISNVVRPDAAYKSLDRDIVLANAPAVIDDVLFEVPLVVNDEGGA